MVRRGPATLEAGTSVACGALGPGALDRQSAVCSSGTSTTSKHSNAAKHTSTAGGRRIFHLVIKTSQIAKRGCVKTESKKYFMVDHNVGIAVNYK